MHTRFQHRNISLKIVLLILLLTLAPATVLSADDAPAVTSTTPEPGATNVGRGDIIQVTFSESVNLANEWIDITCELSGKHLFAEMVVTGAAQNWMVNPDRDYNAGDECTVTIFASKVTDTDTEDPPNTMAANYVFSFTVIVPAGNIVPILDPIGSKTVAADHQLAFQSNASDSNIGQVLTYSLGGGAPLGAQINASTGIFSWTPGAAQVGSTFPVSIIVTDNGTPPLADSELVMITVTAANTDLIANGGFETADGGNPDLPADWLVSDGDVSRRCSGNQLVALQGSCVFRFRGGQVRGSIRQNALSPLMGINDTFTFSASVKPRSAAAGGSLVMKVRYEDGTRGKLSIPVPTGSPATYQYLSGVLVLTGTPVEVVAQIRYTGTTGRMDVDAVSLIWQDNPIVVSPTPNVTATPLPTNTPIPTLTPTPSGGSGQTIPSSRMTGITNLDAPGTGIGSISVQCRMTIDDEGLLHEECWFTNNDNTAKHIVYCDMSDLVAGKKSPFGAPPSAPEFRLQNVGNELRCTPLGGNGASESSFHFACFDIQLDPLEQRKKFEIQSSVPYEPWSTFDVGAWDFQVNYADVWNIGRAGISGYDEDSCSTLIAQGGWLVPDLTPDSAYWVVFAFPFDDPFVAYQPINSREWANAPQYATFDQMPCAPQGLTGASPLAACPLNPGRAPAAVMDINLFYWASHMPMNGVTQTIFPARMSFETSNDISGMGIRKEINPAPGERFEMLAGKEGHGRLALCDAGVTDSCLAPDVPEGTRLKVRYNFFNAEQSTALVNDEAFARSTQFDNIVARQEYSEAEAERWIFAQEATFIKDTKPPVVNSHTARLENGDLVLEVIATDETTEATFANVWYSVDGGATWEQSPLPAAAEFGNGEVKTRTFAGRIPVGANADSVQFMIGIQDTVFNWVYYGIGTAQ